LCGLGAWLAAIWAAGQVGGFDGGLVVGQNAGFGKDVDVRPKVTRGGGFVAVEGCEGLDDLGAAAMAVQYRGKPPMSMRMSKRRAAPAWKARRASSCEPRWRRPNSTISATRRRAARRPDRESAGRGSGWPSKAAWRLVRLRGFRCARRDRPMSGGDGLIAEKFGCGVFQLGPGLHQVLIGLGIFDQGGGCADLVVRS